LHWTGVKSPLHNGPTFRIVSRIPVLVCICMWLYGCGGREVLAPVSEATRTPVAIAPVESITDTPAPIKPVTATPLLHRVVSGETLYAIAWQYSLDYRDIARWNGVPEPYIIYPGQHLVLSGPLTDTSATAKTLPVQPVPQKSPLPAPSISRKAQAKLPPVTKTTAAKAKSPSPKIKPPAKKKPQVKRQAQSSPKPEAGATSLRSNIRWRWPAKGKLIGKFSKHRRKGVDISGLPGQQVMAAADGTVVYSGSGLIGYGKLVIVKHSERYLSAYGHNRKVMVQEGDVVKGGQHIADMGRSGTDRIKLHFEIRRNGKPVNPLTYLPK